MQAFKYEKKNPPITIVNFVDMNQLFEHVQFLNVYYQYYDRFLTW